METKINDSRMKKRESEKIWKQYNSLTPPKYTTKISKINLVKKYCKDMGYDYEDIGYSVKHAPTTQMKW